MEGLLSELSDGLQQLLSGLKMQRSGTLRQHPQPADLGPCGNLKPAGATPRAQFPSLDQGVVQAALQAGVPSHTLAQMEKLVNQNVKARWVPEVNKAAVRLDRSPATL